MTFTSRVSIMNLSKKDWNLKCTDEPIAKKGSEKEVEERMEKKRAGFYRRYLKRNWMLYLMILPGILYITLFKYAPMYGVMVAFKDYKGIGAVSDAPWVGMDNFIRLFSTRAFKRALANNIIISFEKLLFGFPAPIILALMIDGIRRKGFKKLVQTSVILPNFISWIVLYGLLYALVSPSTGAVSQILKAFGYDGRMPDILSSKDTFRGVIVVSHVWKNAGMGTIVYLAAIAGIDQQLYEAAAIDGAGRFRQIWHITLSALRTTIITLLIFRVGEVMYAGFDQIYAMSNDAVISVADIIDTYVFRLGLEQRKFSVATAAGLFQSLVGLVLVLVTNKIAYKVDPDSGIM